MARIEEYRRQENVYTGSTGAMADASAFTGGFDARAGNALMGAASDVADVFEKRKRQDEAIWVDNTVTQARMHWMERMEQLKKEAGPGAGGFTPRVGKEYGEFMKQYLKAAPSGTSQAALLGQLNNLGESLHAQSLVFEAHEQQAKLAQDLNTNLSQKVAMAAMQPELMDELAQGGQSLVNGAQGRLHASQFATLSKKAQQEIYTTALENMARDNPHGAIAKLEEKDKSGKIVLAEKLGGDLYASLYSRYKDAAKRMDSLGSKKNGDALASHLEQIIDHGVDDGFAMGTSMRESPEYKKRAQVAWSQHRINQSIQNAPIEEMQGILARYKPIVKGENQEKVKLFLASNPGAQVPDEVAGDVMIAVRNDETGNPILEKAEFGYSTQKDVFEYAQQAIAKEMQMRKLNPASAADRAPEVRAASAALEALKVDNTAKPEEVAAVRKDLIEKRLNWQKNVGVTDPLGVSLEEAAMVSQSFNTKNPEELRSRMARTMQEYGEYTPHLVAAMQKLPKEARPPLLTTLAFANIGKPHVFHRIHRALYADPKSLESVAGSIPETAKQSAFGAQAVEDFERAVSSVPGVDKIEGIKEMRNALTLVAQDMIVNKEARDFGSAVKKAADLLLPYEYGEYGQKTYLIPKEDPTGRPYSEEEIDNVQLNLEVAASSLLSKPDSELNVDIYNQTPGLADNVVKHRIRTAIQMQGFYSITPDGQAYEFWAPDLNGVPQRIKDGKGQPYRFPVSELTKEMPRRDVSPIELNKAALSSFIPVQ